MNELLIKLEELTKMIKEAEENKNKIEETKSSISALNKEMADRQKMDKKRMCNKSHILRANQLAEGLLRPAVLFHIFPVKRRLTAFQKAVIIAVNPLLIQRVIIAILL